MDTVVSAFIRTLSGVNFLGIFHLDTGFMDVAASTDHCVILMQPIVVFHTIIHR